MKRFVILFLAAGLFAACNNQSGNTENTENTDETSEQTVSGRYGDSSWNTENALDPTSFLLLLEGRDSIQATVSGDISAACQAKGCWMKMDMNGTDMVVRFKDYGFFVPKNSAGYKATIKGWAYNDTLSVAELQEYAKDAGKSEEEIAAITEPEAKLTFMADGVIIE